MEKHISASKKSSAIDSDQFNKGLETIKQLWSDCSKTKKGKQQLQNWIKHKQNPNYGKRTGRLVPLTTDLNKLFPSSPPDFSESDSDIFLPPSTIKKNTTHVSSNKEEVPSFHRQLEEVTPNSESGSSQKNQNFSTSKITKQKLEKNDELSSTKETSGTSEFTPGRFVALSVVDDAQKSVATQDDLVGNLIESREVVDRDAKLKLTSDRMKSPVCSPSSHIESAGRDDSTTKNIFSRDMAYILPVPSHKRLAMDGTNEGSFTETSHASMRTPTRVAAVNKSHNFKKRLSFSGQRVPMTSVSSPKVKPKNAIMLTDEFVSDEFNEDHFIVEPVSYKDSFLSSISLKPHSSAHNKTISTTSVSKKKTKTKKFKSFSKLSKAVSETAITEPTKSNSTTRKSASQHIPFESHSDTTRQKEDNDDEENSSDTTLVETQTNNVSEVHSEASTSRGKKNAEVTNTPRVKQRLENQRSTLKPRNLADSLTAPPDGHFRGMSTRSSRSLKKIPVHHVSSVVENDAQSKTSESNNLNETSTSAKSKTKHKSNNASQKKSFKSQNKRKMDSNNNTSVEESAACATANKHVAKASSIPIPNKRLRSNWKQTESNEQDHSGDIISFKVLRSGSKIIRENSDSSIKTSPVKTKKVLELTNKEKYDSTKHISTSKGSEMSCVREWLSSSSPSGDVGIQRERMSLRSRTENVTKQGPYSKKQRKKAAKNTKEANSRKNESGDSNHKTPARPFDAFAVPRPLTDYPEGFKSGPIKQRSKGFTSSDENKEQQNEFGELPQVDQSSIMNDYGGSTQKRDVVRGPPSSTPRPQRRPNIVADASPEANTTGTTLSSMSENSIDSKDEYAEPYPVYVCDPVMATDNRANVHEDFSDINNTLTEENGPGKKSSAEKKEESAAQSSRKQAKTKPHARDANSSNDCQHNSDQDLSKKNLKRKRQKTSKRKHAEKTIKAENDYNKSSKNTRKEKPSVDKRKAAKKKGKSIWKDFPRYEDLNVLSPPELTVPVPSPRAVELGLRRSSRARVRPLQTWYGERLVYGAENELIGVRVNDQPVQSVVRKEISSDKLSTKANKKHKKLITEKKKKVKKIQHKSKKDKVTHAEPEPVSTMNIAHSTTSWKNQSLSSPSNNNDQTSKFNFTTAEDLNNATVDVLYYGQALQMPVRNLLVIPESEEFFNNQGKTWQENDGVKFTKGISNHLMAVGTLSLAPGYSKGQKYMKKDSLSYYVSRGNVEVVIESATSVVSEGAYFIIPPGNHYDIKNLSNEESAVLTFSQMKHRENIGITTSNNQ